MSYFDFIAENFVIVFGAIGLAITTMWSKIQPFLIKLLSPQPFQPLPFPFPQPQPQPVPQPEPQPVKPQRPQPLADDSESTLLAVTSAAYLIDYFKETKNSKGESHARSAAKSIFEASTDVVSK